MKINLRTIARVIIMLLIALQAMLLLAYLYLGKNSEASQAGILGFWMFQTLYYESVAYNLRKEKEDLLKFLNNPDGNNA